jgi:hypothetical protein
LRLLLLLGLCGGLARPALAERVTIVTYGHKRSPEATRAVSDALSASARGDDAEVVDGFAAARAQVLAGAVPQSELAALGRSRQLMEEGWRSYLEARPTFAATRLAQARTEAMTVAALQGGPELIAEISVRLGVVKLALAREAEAADDFRLARALDPALPVTEQEFKPEVVAAYAAAQSQTRPESAIRVEAVGASQSVRLEVDGRSIRAGEVRLPGGLHLVAARAAGYWPAAQIVSVSSMTPTVRLVLEPHEWAQAALQGRERIRVGASEAATRTVFAAVRLYGDVDAVITVASVWRRGAPTLLAQRCVAEGCGRVVEIGYPRGGLQVAADEVWRELRGSGQAFPPLLQADMRLLRAEKKPARPAVASPERPWWKNHWIWIGVGGAALAGGAIWLASGEDEFAPVITGNTCSFGGC